MCFNEQSARLTWKAKEKETIKEAKAGSECGISIHAYNDFNVDDIIEVFEEQPIQPPKK